jgi:hypothetical protein
MGTTTHEKIDEPAEIGSLPNVVVPAIAPPTSFEPVQTRRVETTVDAMTEETAPRFETARVAGAPPTLPSPPDQPTLPIEQARTPRNLPEIPPVTNALPPDSSLVLVETRDGAPPISDEAANETPRPKRARPPRVEIASEPLEMVETHKDATTSGP